MRVCILSDESIEDFNPAELLKDHEWDFWTVEPPVEEFIRRVSSWKEYDVFLNIYEGYQDDNTSYETAGAAQPSFYRCGHEIL